MDKPDQAQVKHVTSLPNLQDLNKLVIQYNMKPVKSLCVICTCLDEACVN